jgi:hypothetical protein
MTNSDLLDGGLCSWCFEIVHGTLWVEVKTIPSLFSLSVYYYIQDTLSRDGYLNCCHVLDYEAKCFEICNNLMLFFFHSVT